MSGAALGGEVAAEVRRWVMRMMEEHDEAWASLRASQCLQTREQTSRLTFCGKRKDHDGYRTIATVSRRLLVKEEKAGRRGRGSWGESRPLSGAARADVFDGGTNG
ncbi:hypothetical protein COP2_045177 [Malus domestica]